MGTWKVVIRDEHLRAEIKESARASPFMTNNNQMIVWTVWPNQIQRIGTETKLPLQDVKEQINKKPKIKVPRNWSSKRRVGPYWGAMKTAADFAAKERCWLIDASFSVNGMRPRVSFISLKSRSTERKWKLSTRIMIVSYRQFGERSNDENISNCGSAEERVSPLPENWETTAARDPTSITGFESGTIGEHVKVFRRRAMTNNRLGHLNCEK